MADQRSILGALVAVAVGSVVALLAAEAIARAFYQPGPARIYGLQLRSSDYFQPDPQLGWLPRANAFGTQPRFPGTSFKTNSKGLRDREYDEEKTAGVTRIVVVGDSHTWGYGVNDDEIYSEQLEVMLGDSEVINLGVTAYGLWQEVDYFRRTGLRYAPDILIVGFTQNDVDNGANRRNIELANATHEEQTASNGGSQSFRQSNFEKFRRILALNSALYMLVVDRINTSKGLVKLLIRLGLKDPLSGAGEIDNNLVVALRDPPPGIEKSFRAVETKLGELKALADREGVRLIVVAIPARQTIEAVSFRKMIARSIFEPDDFDLDKPYRRLAAFAQKEGIEFLNPVGRFRASPLKEEGLYLKRDIHLSPAGHELLARVIADYIVRTTSSAMSDRLPTSASAKPGEHTK